MPEIPLTNSSATSGYWSELLGNILVERNIPAGTVITLRPERNILSNIAYMVVKYHKTGIAYDVLKEGRPKVMPDPYLDFKVPDFRGTVFLDIFYTGDLSRKTILMQW